MGLWFYVFTVGAALLESMLILGTFVPGTVVLLFFGFTASHSDLSLFWIIIATSFGAIVGDFINYVLGRYGRSFIKEKKGLLRMSHIEVGKAFFSKHGGKSVLLGRFVSPIRQIIPLIAGMVHMSYRRFTWLNIAGALLWSGAYVVLGYYFGSQSELIDKLISRIGYVITGLLFIGALYLFYRRRSKRLAALQENHGIQTEAIVVGSPDVVSISVQSNKQEGDVSQRVAALDMGVTVPTAVAAKNSETL